jgi:hypothetical protein
MNRNEINKRHFPAETAMYFSRNSELSNGDLTSIKSLKNYKEVKN